MANKNSKNNKDSENSNKWLIALLGLSLILVVAGFALVAKGRSGTGQGKFLPGISDAKPTTTTDNTDSQTQSQTQTGTQTETQVASKNGYVSLSEYQANKSAYSAGKVVLFFNARWCPTCKVLDESLKKQAAKFPADLTVVDVDYDNAADLIKQYKIAYQHVLVQIDADGKEITRWAGGGDLQSITDQLK